VTIARRPPAHLFKFDTDAWTAPFWEAAKAHRLVVARCASCGHHRMPPTPFCPGCRSQEIDWAESAGRGAVYSYTVVSREIMPGMADSLPYVPAVITLDDAGGVRLISNVVDAEVEAIVVGAPVDVVWDDREDGITVARFRLVAEANT
jgi:uncharacterized OB-fold protein